MLTLFLHQNHACSGFERFSRSIAPYYFLLYYFAAMIVCILSRYIYIYMCVCSPRQCALDCPVQRHCKEDPWEPGSRWVSAADAPLCMQKSVLRLTLSGFPPQTVLLSVFMFQLFRTVGLRAFSMASETYMSGTHSAAFITCPNDTVAKDLARCGAQIQTNDIPTPS